jgi:hypothetical protein
MGVAWRGRSMQSFTRVLRHELGRVRGWPGDLWPSVCWALGDRSWSGVTLGSTSPLWNIPLITIPKLIKHVGMEIDERWIDTEVAGPVGKKILYVGIVH